MKNSTTCEVRLPGGNVCGKPSTSGYPALAGQWMALCEKHMVQHLPMLPVADISKLSLPLEASEYGGAVWIDDADGNTVAELHCENALEKAQVIVTIVNLLSPP